MYYTCTINNNTHAINTLRFIEKKQIHANYHGIFFYSYHFVSHIYHLQHRLCYSYLFQVVDVLQ